MPIVLSLSPFVFHARLMTIEHNVGCAHCCWHVIAVGKVDGLRYVGDVAYVISLVKSFA